MGTQNTNRQKLIANKKGFSLLELLVAIFIFSVVMVASTGIFGSSIKGYRNAKAIQKDMENAQDAMSVIAKTLRTSTVYECFGVAWGDCSTPPFQAIRIYDHSQNKCVMYGFRSSDNVLEAIKFSIAGTDDPAVECINGANYGGSSAASDLVDTGNVTGQFDVIQSVVGQIGKITVSMEVAPNPSTPEKDKARIQTTVSLRDYDEAGL
ncbi:hypothetical protein BMS3Abin15_01086 [bacterium BMS3Abin15]|nr:hypothetical protein BMS3Abin15_01086 [bacterium BMS3Abin15]HDZ85809.1 prepilin-type N-terminal cleavage/methylation domain-containing protein [Candidatus Moranbacteria bacterium]